MILFGLIQGKRFRKGLIMLGLTALLLALLLTAFLNQQAPTLAGANATTGGPYQVNYQVVDQWNSGYNIEVKITNTGTTAVKNWTISWQLSQNEQSLSDIWDASCNLANNRLSCSNASWNNTIRPGSTVKFGLDLYGNGKVTQPTSFIVNDITVSTQNNTTATATSKPATAVATATSKPATAIPTKTSAATPTSTKAPTVAPSATPTATRIPPTATVTPGSTGAGGNQPRINR